MKRFLILMLIAGLFAFNANAQRGKKQFIYIKGTTVPSERFYKNYEAETGIKFQKINYDNDVRNIFVGAFGEHFDGQYSAGLRYSIIGGRQKGILRAGIGGKAGWNFGKEMPVIAGGILTEWKVFEFMSLNIDALVSSSGGALIFEDEKEPNAPYFQIKTGLTINF